MRLCTDAQVSRLGDQSLLKSDFGSLEVTAKVADARVVGCVGLLQSAPPLCLSSPGHRMHLAGLAVGNLVDEGCHERWAELGHLSRRLSKVRDVDITASQQVWPAHRLGRCHPERSPERSKCTLRCRWLCSGRPVAGRYPCPALPDDSTSCQSARP